MASNTLVLVNFKFGVVNEGQLIVPKDAAQMSPVNCDLDMSFGLRHCVSVNVNFNAFFFKAKPALKYTCDFCWVRVVVDDVSASLTDEIGHVVRVCVQQPTSMALYMNCAQTKLTENYRVLWLW
jgi:hypothetical protein